MAQETGPHSESNHHHLSPFSILILTGLSGSGKSTVLRALEDTGYFCVDNLPLGLLLPFLDMQSAAVSSGRRIALVMDIRTEGFLQNFSQVFRRLEELGHHLHIIFLEADDATLMRRFSQTRRQHPLADHDTIVQALRQDTAAHCTLVGQWVRDRKDLLGEPPVHPDEQRTSMSGQAEPQGSGYA